jgi:hypothetical protein
LVRFTVDWASEKVMRVYIREVFTSHFVINSLSNSTVQTLLIPLEVLNDPEKMHSCLISSVRWPASTSYDQLVVEWKASFTMSLDLSLSADEKDSLARKAFRTALLRYSKSLGIGTGMNTSSKCKVTRELIISKINNDSRCVNAIKQNFTKLVATDFISITKAIFDDTYEPIVPKQQKPLRRNYRHNWSVEEEAIFQGVFKTSKKADGKYDYTKIISNLRHRINRTDDQIRWKVTWTAAKEKKLDNSTVLSPKNLSVKRTSIGDDVSDKRQSVRP